MPDGYIKRRVSVIAALKRFTFFLLSVKRSLQCRPCTRHRQILVVPQQIVVTSLRSTGENTFSPVRIFHACLLPFPLLPPNLIVTRHLVAPVNQKRKESSFPTIGGYSSTRRARRLEVLRGMVIRLKKNQFFFFTFSRSICFR